MVRIRVRQLWTETNALFTAVFLDFMLHSAGLCGAMLRGVARVWSIGASDQMRCAIDQFVISAAFYQLRNS